MDGVDDVKDHDVRKGPLDVGGKVLARGETAAEEMLVEVAIRRGKGHFQGQLVPELEFGLDGAACGAMLSPNGHDTSNEVPRHGGVGQPVLVGELEAARHDPSQSANPGLVVAD